MLMGLILAVPAMAADKVPAARTLFTHVNVFDGEHEKLIGNANVLIEGNLIKQVSTQEIAADGATVIDGKGRTLMPGLIDAHYHPMFAAIGQAAALTSIDGYLNLVAGKNAEPLLLQGFTTVREASGNSFSLKRAIDQGLYAGPRIYVRPCRLSIGHIGALRSRCIAELP